MNAVCSGFAPKVIKLLILVCKVWFKSTVSPTILNPESIQEKVTFSVSVKFPDIPLVNKYSILISEPVGGFEPKLPLPKYTSIPPDMPVFTI